MEVKLHNDEAWTLVPPARGRRGSQRPGATSAAVADDLPPQFLREGVEVALVRTVAPKVHRRGERPPISFSVECAPGERAITVARHPSAALTFHPPVYRTSTRSGARRGKERSVLEFEIELAEGAPVRRGVLSAGLRLLVVKVKEKLVDAALSAGLRLASHAAESLWWKKRNLAEGWRAVNEAAHGFALSKISTDSIQGKRSLLLIHGTFSDTAGSFGKWLRPEVLLQLHDRYEGRVFAFEHFSVSRSPEENARALLEFLPDREQIFDAVAYSRGGLLLRMIAEQPQRFGHLARRFRLEHGVLVAVPNGGTPLASGQRWEQTFGFVANLLELVPDNPWTTAAQFIADGIVWLAGHVTGDLPGLAAMDAQGETIASLQDVNGPVYPRYSAIGANYHPDHNMWARLLDAGVDGFFSGANDLVVPTNGAWDVDPATPSVVPAERIGCFGFGGNLRVHSGAVNHFNILAQDEVAQFILGALKGDRLDWPPLDLSKPILSRRIWRGSAANQRREALTPREFAGASAPTGTPAVAMQAFSYSLSVVKAEQEGDRTLQLMILGDPKASNLAQILAMYGSARVMEPFPLRNRPGEIGAGSRFRNIIKMHEEIQMNLEGRVSKRSKQVPALPTDEELREFGGYLFDTIFTGRIRRLYDLARSEQRIRPLNVIFTCTIPWVAAKPWEFAFDPNRRKFLATEEIHFIRNVLTAVPAQRVDIEREKLRLLVVEAQPVGTAPLAIEEEEAQLKEKFRPLTEANLIQIDVLARATPDRLHEMILGRSLDRCPYHIVHFIGHGEFDREANAGRLLFHAGDDGHQPVDVQTLREILCGRGLQVVFLNACDTARDDARSLNRGVAQGLVEGGLPAVVANQYKVLDPSAVAFAQHFYWSLTNGATLGEAAREARIAVNYSIDGEIIDWAVPVLYARYPDQQLCERKAKSALLKRPPPQDAAQPRASIKATHALKPTIVGVSDLARYFSGLTETLNRLNGVQSRFNFRLVEVNTPMGVWQRQVDEKKTYLHAERFADKLKAKPKALGVDYLGCITNWWMCDDETLNIYGWWSGEQKLPVLVFSTAGLALPTRGARAGRVIANALVQGLAAQLVESHANVSCIHEDPPRNCPFYFNEYRDIESVTGRLQFSEQSRKLLLTCLPKKLDPPGVISAFDAILGAFDHE